MEGNDHQFLLLVAKRESQRAIASKLQGNIYFAQEKWQLAFDEYTDALMKLPSIVQFGHVRSGPAESSATIDQLKLTLYCNRAAASLKLGWYAAAILDASSAIAESVNGVEVHQNILRKAYVRRASALQLLGYELRANRDLAFLQDHALAAPSPLNARATHAPSAHHAVARPQSNSRWNSRPDWAQQVETFLPVVDLMRLRAVNQSWKRGVERNSSAWMRAERSLLGGLLRLRKQSPEPRHQLQRWQRVRREMQVLVGSCLPPLSSGRVGTAMKRPRNEATDSDGGQNTSDIAEEGRDISPAAGTRAEDAAQRDDVASLNTDTLAFVDAAVDSGALNDLDFPPPSQADMPVGDNSASSSTATSSDRDNAGGSDASSSDDSSQEIVRLKVLKSRKLRTPIVIDIGTGYTKAGFAGQSAPALVTPNFFLESGRDITRMGRIQTENLIPFLYKAVFSRLRVSPQHHPIILVVDLYSLANARLQVELDEARIEKGQRADNKSVVEAVSCLEYKLRVPGVRVQQSAPVTLRYHKLRNGVVVDIGLGTLLWLVATACTAAAMNFHFIYLCLGLTRATPVVNGKAVPTAARVQFYGSANLTNMLLAATQEFMHREAEAFSHLAGFEVMLMAKATKEDQLRIAPTYAEAVEVIPPTTELTHFRTVGID